jgi:nitrogen regulatory protein PII
MEKLHELQEDFEQEGLTLELVGLESHQKLSDHAHSARRRGLTRIRRITIVAPEERAETIVRELLARGATGYTISDCRGAGRSTLLNPSAPRKPLVRVEVLVATSKLEALITHISKDIRSDTPITVAVETVEVMRPDHY